MSDKKIILTGATGFIGGEVLQQCLAHPSISSVVVLSRRSLPEPLSKHPKLKVIIHQDFSTGYPPDLLEEVIDADVCIWAMGLLGSKAENADVARRVNLDYTIAAVEAFDQVLAFNASKRGSSGFRFLYLSGNMAVRDQKSSPWFLGESRRMRGEVENRLIALDRSRSFDGMNAERDHIEVFIFRPSFVLSRDKKLGSALLRATMPSASIKVNDLAAVMVDVAVEGSKEQAMELASIASRLKALKSQSV